MENVFRLADAVNSHDPPGTHHDLGCKVILTIAIWVSFFCCLCLDSSFNGSAQDCHTTSRYRVEEMSLVMRLG